jgi:5-methylcytosine-specific restriction endonuclease McrA
VKIPQNIQTLVRQRANFLCEYCHSPEFLSTAPLTIDHLTPQSLGGADDIENLALACRRCNERRYNFTTGIDPETQKESLHTAITFLGTRLEGTIAQYNL